MLNAKAMRASLLLLAVLGCGDDGPSTGQVAVHAFGTKLVAIQDGGSWRPLAVPGDGETNITVTGPFTVASVCDEPGFFGYYVTYGGVGSKELFLSCSTPGTVSVSLMPGTNVEAGISFYPLRDGWSWDIKPGTYDIVAYDRTLMPPRFEIRRGVSITQDTVLS